MWRLSQRRSSRWQQGKTPAQSSWDCLEASLQSIFHISWIFLLMITSAQVINGDSRVELFLVHSTTIERGPFDMWSEVLEKDAARSLRGHVMETLGSILCRGWRQSQKWDRVTDAIKYLKLLIVQLESVPVLLGYSRSKEALWTRAVNFLLPRLASSHPETKPCVHSITLCKSAVQKQTEVLFFSHVVPNFGVSPQKLSY